MCGEARVATVQRAKPLASTTKEHLVASRLNPYLSFRDNAREAMEYYKSVFGGTLTMNTFGEYGAQAPTPTSSCTPSSRPTPATP